MKERSRRGRGGSDCSQGEQGAEVEGNQGKETAWVQGHMSRRRWWGRGEGIGKGDIAEVTRERQGEGREA